MRLLQCRLPWFGCLAEHRARKPARRAPLAATNKRPVDFVPSDQRRKGPVIQAKGLTPFVRQGHKSAGGNGRAKHAYPS
jgi:hypothetical protein